MPNKECDMLVQIVQNVDRKYVLIDVMKDLNVHVSFQITTTL